MKKPIILTIVVCLLFMLTGIVLRNAPGTENLPPRKALAEFPTQVGDWRGERRYLAPEVVDALWADEYVLIEYHAPQTQGFINLLIPFYEYQTTRHTAHAPQSCLLGSGWSLVNSAKLGVEGPGALEVMEMSNAGAHILAAYFFYERGRVITDPWENKFYLMWDSITRRRTDGALVRVEYFVPQGRPTGQDRETLRGFIQTLWPMLKEYVPE